MSERELIQPGEAVHIHCCGKKFNAARAYTPRCRVLRCDGVWHVAGPCFPCLLTGELGTELAKAGIVMVHIAEKPE